MSLKIVVPVSLAVLGFGLYALCGTHTTNPVRQTAQLIELQKDILAQLELQSRVLIQIREDSLAEHE